MTSMGTGTLEKKKQTKFRRFPPPPKRKIKNITFPIDKVGKRGYSNVINKNNKQY